MDKYCKEVTLLGIVILFCMTFVFAQTSNTLWTRTYGDLPFGDEGHLVRETDVKELEWIDPYGRQPTKYSKWSKEHIDRSKPTSIGNVYNKTISGRQNVVDIVVNSSIFSYITAELDTFTQDLVNAGYLVQLDTLSGMSHTELRSHLASISDLVGAIFIGELPVAWFEFGVEDFPHDLYFSDLDGTYIDSDNNGIYDDHTGSVEPEIWVGRIHARNLTWDNEIRLLKNYFYKNHQYRTVGSSLPQRALSFIDDDWNYYTTCCLDSVYSDVVVINDKWETTASNYRSELAGGYEWIHLFAHSSAWGHTFLYPFNQYRGTVFNYEIFTLEPQALFYNLDACSGTRFTEENISGGWYLFVDPYGLLIVGSTTTGGMLYFEDFYGPIGQQGMCIGEAFKYWFTLWGVTDWDWFYGMSILGDPTLKPLGQVALRPARKNYSPSHKIIGWTTPEVVASDPESDGFPKIATNIDGKVWVIWESGRSTSNGRSEIYSAYRDVIGWSSAMNIGPYTYYDFGPYIATDNLNRPIAVWASDDWHYDLYYSVYDGSWSPKQLVHTAALRNDTKPVMVKDNNGDVWVAWESARDLDLNIYTALFDGSLWSLAEQVTTDSTDETTPVMAVDSVGRPWIFYCKRFETCSEIWGSYYTGSQWLTSGPVSGSHRHAYHPAAAVDEDGNIWVVWQSSDNGNVDIYSSFFNGSTWSPPHQVTASPENDLFPSLTTYTDGTICLVYQSKAGGDWNIHYAYCIDSTWSTPEIVADLTGADINPHITCDTSGKLWTCWQSYSSDNWEIMVSYRVRPGAAEQREVFARLNFTVSPTIFSDRVNIAFQILDGRLQKEECSLKIFDISGRLVKSFRHTPDAIRNRLSWDGTHDFGQKLPSGVYFLSFKIGDYKETKKLILLR